MRLLLSSFYVDQILAYETVICFRVRGSVLLSIFLEWVAKSSCFKWGSWGRFALILLERRLMFARVRMAVPLGFVGKASRGWHCAIA